MLRLCGFRSLGGNRLAARDLARRKAAIALFEFYQRYIWWDSVDVVISEQSGAETNEDEGEEKCKFN
jgi:hypothetical protein